MSDTTQIRPMHMNLYDAYQRMVKLTVDSKEMYPTGIYRDGWEHFMVLRLPDDFETIINFDPIMYWEHEGWKPTQVDLAATDWRDKLIRREKSPHWIDDNLNADEIDESERPAMVTRLYHLATEFGWNNTMGQACLKAAAELDDNVCGIWNTFHLAPCGAKPKDVIDHSFNPMLACCRVSLQRCEHAKQAKRDQYGKKPIPPNESTLPG